jgi:multidrug efflux system membrane fusion protein
VNSDQAQIENAAATLSYTKIIAPLSGRAGLRQVDQGNIIHASDVTGLVFITQLQPIAVTFSLPQQQIMRVNVAAAKGELVVDVFGNDGVTVIDTGKLSGIDNQVDPTTGTLKLKAEFPNGNFQLWPGQFVNVRLKVDTLSKAIVVPTSAVARPRGDVHLRHWRRRHRHREAGCGDAAERNRCSYRQRIVAR